MRTLSCQIPTISSLLAASFLSIACSPETIVEPIADTGLVDTGFDAGHDVGHDSRTDVGTDSGQGMTGRTYFLDVVSIPVASDNPNNMAGHNLDNRVTAPAGNSCTDRLDQQHSIFGMGIDNQLDLMLVQSEQQLCGASNCVNTQLAANIRAGNLVLTATFEEGNVVVLRRVNAGQFVPMFDGDRAKLNQVAPVGVELARATAQVNGNRISLNLPSFNLPLTIGEDLREFTMRDVHLEIQTQGETLQIGALGGIVALNDIVTIVEAERPGYGEISRLILETFSDFEPNSATTPKCQSISFGVSFSGTPISLQ